MENYLTNSNSNPASRPNSTSVYRSEYLLRDDETNRFVRAPNHNFDIFNNITTRNSFNKTINNNNQNFENIESANTSRSSSICELSNIHRKLSNINNREQSNILRDFNNVDLNERQNEESHFKQYPDHNALSVRNIRSTQPNMFNRERLNDKTPPLPPHLLLQTQA